MKLLHQILIAGITAASCAGSGAAQTVVAGTGDPDIDIAAVQSAVDRGGAVTLRGRFSFDNPPTGHGRMPDLMATILVSKEVTISGAWDERGQMTEIDGGEIPFAVEAGGATVSIERLHFVRPKLFAILVAEAGGLTIESCIMERVEARLLPGNGSGLTSGLGIYVTTVMGLPTPDRPGNPANVSGKLSILNNEISIGGAPDHGIGIMLVAIGSAEKPLEADVSGNTIRNANLKGINVTQISGHARVERNTVIVSGADGRARLLGSGIHCGGTGSYLIARNVIEVLDPSKAGIRIRGYPALGSAVERATISDNDITMSAPEGAVFGATNAGIEIMGMARGSIIQRNRIRGRARVWLSVAPDKTGYPSGTTFDRNDYRSLISTPAVRDQQK